MEELQHARGLERTLVVKRLLCLFQKLASHLDRLFDGFHMSPLTERSERRLKTSQLNNELSYIIQILKVRRTRCDL